MAGRKSKISQTRSALYTAAKILGDISAISKGPGAVGKRIARRAAGKATSKLLGKLFK
ncbi:hypothetical protein [Desulfotruncus alcoholivorax]|uniref:hypothetical protein n=1 Tax=Desulfotruncus alcoholivorax TaxID=265477 RepID=UPI0004115412|nr:hypothetical protein [Desulfotruncus alcoholivorax]